MEHLMKFIRKRVWIMGLSAIFLLTFQGCSQHANYPVTRLAGWAPEQHVQWEVLELAAEFESQSFSLYKSKTQLLIKARVKVHSHLTSTHKIKKLHISQRTIEENIDNVAGIEIKVPGRVTLPNPIFIQQYKEKHLTDTIPFTLIEITPVFEADEQHVKGEPTPFDLKIEEPIQNSHWGRNYYRVKLGDQTLDLGTAQ